MRLSHGDFDALQGAILELHEHRDRSALLDAAPRLFMSVIPSEYFGIFDLHVDLASRRVAVAGYWESCPRIDDDFVARSERIGFEHPFTQYSMTTADPTALKFSDFFSMRQFRDSSLYSEFYGPVGIDRLLGVAVLTPSGMLTLNAIRQARERDFTERDRLVLNLLQPHFAQVRRQVELTARRPAVDGIPFAAYRLTPRETDVAVWLSRGKSNQEIALILHMGARTVEKHVERILAKLGGENRTTAALVITEARRKP